MNDVSVIIPTRNSARTIGQCLDSLSRQTLACAEVIVVDDFSYDETARLAADSGATVLRARANRSQARNIGLKSATSAGVLFLDSDMIAPLGLIEECARGLEQFDSLIIPELSVGRGFWADCVSLERRTYRGDDLIEAARCFRRDLLMSLGGYRGELEAGEDWDLQNRFRANGLSTGRIAETILHDEGLLSLVSILQKKFKYGMTFRKYLGMSPTIGARQINPIKRIIGTTLKVSASDPVHGMGVFVLKTLEFIVAGTGAIWRAYDRSEVQKFDPSMRASA